MSCLAGIETKMNHSFSFPVGKTFGSVEKGQKSPEKQISHDFRCEIDPCENTENTGSLSPYESPEENMPIGVFYPPRKQEKMLENRSEGPRRPWKAPQEGPQRGAHPIDFGPPKSGTRGVPRGDPNCLAVVHGTRNLLATNFQMPTFSPQMCPRGGDECSSIRNAIAWKKSAEKTSLPPLETSPTDPAHKTVCLRVGPTVLGTRSTPHRVRNPLRPCPPDCPSLPGPTEERPWASRITGSGGRATQD